MYENVSTLMHSKLDESLYKLLQTAGEIAFENGFILYLVGGAVRDFFLDLPISDIDFVVDSYEINDASLESGPYLANVFAKNFLSKVSSVSQFGTAKIKLEGFNVDIATSRSEVYPHPGSLPVVQANSIYNDLKRRDFTINSIAICLSPENFGAVLDPFSGLEHLKNKLLHIHHQNSFQDDATRILRGLRYHSRLNFAFSDTTEKILVNNAYYLKEISGDRIRNELLRIFDEDKVAEILLTGNDLGVLSEIHSSFLWDIEKILGYNFLKKYIDDLDDFVCFALLIMGINYEDAKSLIIRLNANGLWNEVISNMALLNNRMPELIKKNISRSYIYDSLLGLNKLTLIAHGSLQSNKVISDILFNFEELKADAKLEIDGLRLIELGVPEGEHIGEILLELQHERLDGKIKNIIDEEKFVYEKLKILGFDSSSNE